MYVLAKVLRLKRISYKVTKSLAWHICPFYLQMIYLPSGEPVMKWCDIYDATEVMFINAVPV